jgi:hypothetical protein
MICQKPLWLINSFFQKLIKAESHTKRNKKVQKSLLRGMFAREPRIFLQPNRFDITDFFQPFFFFFLQIAASGYDFFHQSLLQQKWSWEKAVRSA